MHDDPYNPNNLPGSGSRPDMSGFHPHPATPPAHHAPPAPVLETPRQTFLPPETSTQQTSSNQPLAVVKVLSVRGIEYLFMSIFLWLGAGSLIVLILSIVNGESGFDTLAFPLSLLLIALPGFAWLFLRLKKAELKDPMLKYDPSKRRATQRTQVLAFLVCLVNLISYVYLLLKSLSEENSGDLGKATLNMLVILLVAGGVLAYYWVDEHRQGQ